jgi:pimeloyl-ACP methyl ester carboxylesterase
MEFEQDYIDTNGIRLHVVQAGPKSGVPVILLHGFPEHWYGWIQPTKGIDINETVCYFPTEKCAKWMN